MTQSEANPSLGLWFPASREKSREQCFFGLPEGTGAPKNDCSTSLFDRFPYSREQGNSRPSREVLLTMQGNLSFGLFVLLNLQRRIPLAAAQVKSRKGEALKPTTDADYDE